MNHDPLQNILEEAKARRAITPANGSVIQRVLEISQQEQSSATRRSFGLALSLALAGTVTVGIGLYKLSPRFQPEPLPHLVKIDSSSHGSHGLKSMTPKETKPVPASRKSQTANKRSQTHTHSPARALFPPETPPSGGRQDDLDYVNEAGSEAAIQHWAQLPQDEQLAQLERIKAIVKGGDDFIDVPLPMVATTATATAAEALTIYQAERQIVDGRLAQGVTLGAKALSFTELCAELTRKTGVTFTAAPSVADDKVTIFCTKRPVRELMREITNLFGFTWNRSGQPDEYSYRLTQPVKAQLAEQELRNQNRNNVVFLRFRRSANRDGEFTVLMADNNLAIVQTKPGETPVVDKATFSVSLTTPPSSAASGEEQIVLENTTSTPLAFHLSNVLTFTPNVNNAERNKALKLLPELLRKVTIAPVPGEREPLLPGEGAPESMFTGRTGAKDEPQLVTTADLLEAIHKATGRDVLGDAFTRLLPALSVTAKNLPLFDALNTVCQPFGLQWSRERNWFQLRSASFYNDRPTEIPNRFLQRWATSRRVKRGLDQLDMAEIATLRDEQLDAANTAQGARMIQNLREWHMATSEILRPHWRFFSSLTPEQRNRALTPDGLAFRDLRQAQQWELLWLAFEKKDNVASVATQLGTIRLCVEKSRFIYHYTRPDGTPSEVVFAASP